MRKTVLSLVIVILLLFSVTGVLGVSAPAAAQQERTVEGRGWIGPLTYNFSGVTLGPLHQESYNLHDYRQGKFNAPTVIEIWGTAHNNAHDLVGSVNYADG